MRTPSLNILIVVEESFSALGPMLSKSLVRSGYSIVAAPRRLGDHNSFLIRASREQIDALSDEVNLVITEHGILISELSVETLAKQDFSFQSKPMIPVPFEAFSSPELAWVWALGVSARLLELNQELVEGVLKKFHLHSDLSDDYRRALSAGYECSDAQSTSIKKLQSVYHPPKRVLLTGCEAIAFGALSAGVKFYPHYPEISSSGLYQTLRTHAKKAQLVLEPTNDGASAISMALGASFAGLPSIIETSGDGLCRLSEGIDVAWVTETPILVIVAQSQDETDLITHLTQRDSQLAIFTPGTAEECFHLTRRALELAEAYQGPIFILIDQFSGNSYRTVEPFDMERLSTIHIAAKPITGAPIYSRYQLTEDGVSPRLLPGTPRALVVANSHEHGEDGWNSDYPATRESMAKKRMKKLEGIRSKVIPPRYEGVPNPDLILISCGSANGAVSEATSFMKGTGARVAALTFSQIWPLVPEQFLKYLTKAGKVVCVETNATGQFADLIQRETGYEVSKRKRLLRTDGQPITAEYIVDAVHGNN